MTGWTRSDTIEGNGYFWTNTAEGIAAFEDTSTGVSQWYAWVGDADDHDDAGHGHVMPTLAEAVENLNAIIRGDIAP